MSAPAALTVAESDAICCRAERIAVEAERLALEFGVIHADRDRLRLAHHLALDSLGTLRTLILRGDDREADAILAALVAHVAAHAYGAMPEPLPAGVTDLDEARWRREARR